MIILLYSYISTLLYDYIEDALRAVTAAPSTSGSSHFSSKICCKIVAKTKVQCRGDDARFLRKSGENQPKSTKNHPKSIKINKNRSPRPSGLQNQQRIAKIPCKIVFFSCFEFFVIFKPKPFTFGEP